MTDDDRARILSRLRDRWPYPEPPDAETIQTFLEEYARVRAYLRAENILSR